METDSVSIKRILEFQSNLQKFIDHVEELKNEEDPAGDGFSREFRIIREHGVKMKEENTYPALEGKKPCNVKKNRYRDILPFDATRVVLKEIEGEEGSDYINANLIKDCNNHDTYIASQGPVAATVGDFWRMVWQYKVRVIAMACKLVELGKKKCEMYWPEKLDTPETFGEFEVTMIATEDLADDCTRRTLEVKKGEKVHQVTQFHYTGWPDHDIPNDFDVILEMIAEMRQIKMADTQNAPMVIHCSAGCGRTGTICAIDYAWDLLKHARLDEKFNLFDIIEGLRTQRQSMIQAPEQYMMAHVTVAELFKKHLELIEDHAYGNISFENEDNQTNNNDKTPDNKSELSVASSSSHKNSLLDLEVQALIKQFTVTPTQIEQTVERLSPKSANKSAETHKFPVLEIVNAPRPSSPSPNYTNVVSNTEAQSKPKGEAMQTVSSKPDVANGEKKPVFTAQSSRIESSLKGNRYVTNISVGGSTAKPPLTPSKSEPAKPTAGGIRPTGQKHNSLTEKPQSSIAPAPRPQSGGGVYSMAQDTNDNAYSYVNKTKDNAYSFAKENKDNVYSFAKGPSGDAYSQLSNYSSAGNSYPYSYADVQPVDSHNSQQQQQVPPLLPPNKPSCHYSYAQDPLQKGNSDPTYSFAMEPDSKEYSPVIKQTALPGSKNNQISVESVYEAIAPGNQVRNVAPPLPVRQYSVEEEQLDKQTSPNESSTTGKSQMISTLKSLFTTGSKTTPNDHVQASDIPGFQKRIEKRPSGPREKPKSWAQKPS